MHWLWSVSNNEQGERIQALPPDDAYSGFLDTMQELIFPDEDCQMPSVVPPIWSSVLVASSDQCEIPNLSGVVDDPPFHRIPSEE